MKFSELNDSDKKVIVGIHKAIIARGADWVYPNEVKTDPITGDSTFDEDWTNDTGGCYNLLNDGSAACIIGFVAVDQGLPTQRVSNALADGRRWDVSSPLINAMGSAQSEQDRKEPWGDALHVFNLSLRGQITDYDKFLPVLLSSHGIALIDGKPVGIPNSQGVNK